jgi:hypothetical protein
MAMSPHPQVAKSRFVVPIRASRWRFNLRIYKNHFGTGERIACGVPSPNVAKLS